MCRIMSFINIGSKGKQFYIPTKSYVYKHRYFLNRLLTIIREVSTGQRSPEELHIFVKKASPSELKALGEVCRNVLKKKHPKVKVTGFIKKLSPFKNLIRKLACGKTTLPSKRRALTTTTNQVGGLPFLIPLLAPIVSTLISAGIQAAI